MATLQTEAQTSEFGPHQPVPWLLESSLVTAHPTDRCRLLHGALGRIRQGTEGLCLGKMLWSCWGRGRGEGERGPEPTLKGPFGEEGLSLEPV